MALPTIYLTTTKNLEGILNAIQSAKAPPKFTQRFLEDLGFKGNPDRLIIRLLKALGFLTPDGAPTQRYFDFLDQGQSRRVLADAIEATYTDLYQLRRDAHNLPRPELIGKMKTLTQGQVGDSALEKMAMTFTSLVKLADFDAPAASRSSRTESNAAPADHRATNEPPDDGGDDLSRGRGQSPIALGGLVYNIELHLPESRDSAVFEALFGALKTHLLS